MPTATTITHEKPIPNNTDQEWTCSMWVKLDTVGQGNIQLNNFNLGNRIVHSANGHALMYLNSGTNDYYNYGNLAVTANVWTHIAFVFKNSNATKLIYINGVNHTNTGGPNKTSTPAGIPNTVTVGTNLAGYISDYRVYCTALSTADVKQLYEMGAKIDNRQNLHTYEIKETNDNLLAGRVWTSPYSYHNPLTNTFTNFNSNGEYQFTANGTSAGSEYIPINPSGHTYEYDYTISVNAGNQFYIGFERYDADKTARSNNACTYTYATKPSTDVIKQHYKGTVNLSTDGTNPCAFIALRILNGWSGTTSGVTGTATIHSFSLREIGTKQQPKLKKTGTFIEEELKEETATKLHKNGIVETNNLIEF